MDKSDNPTDQPQPVGRKRLIEAAVRLFGREGFDAVPLRALAKEAGVSWGLIRFYFGSKDGLREAAEEWVVSSYLDLVSKASKVANLSELLDLINTNTTDLPDVARFLRRAIIEDRPIAIEFIRRLLEADVEHYKALRKEFPEEQWLGDPVRNVVVRLGYLLIAPQLEKLIGRDVFSAEEVKARNAREARTFELLRRGLQAEQSEKVGTRRRR
jgi:AcrR family transcriptional regulator